MSFVCPECSSPGSLKITLRLELPPDSRSDEITLQVVQCSACRFAAVAVYQESRRGGLAFESFEHVGYRLSHGELKLVRNAIRRCPDRNNRRCQCSVHQFYGRRDISGRWNGLGEIEYEATFELIL